MRDEKRRRLEAKGWKVGTPAELLGLTPEEAAYVEIRLRLASGVKRQRIRRGVTQVALAKAIRSSQSRVAKMEAGDPSVAIDLLVRTLLVLGANDRAIAAMIVGTPARAA